MNKLALITLTVFTCLSLTQAEMVVIQPAENGRVWQTVLNPSEPLRWPWIDRADAARLTVTSHWNNAVNTTVISTNGNDVYGTFALAAPAAGEERLYSVVLDYLSGETVLESYSARLAYIAGVQGQGIAVRKSGPKRTRENIAILAYDCRWSDTSFNASNATLTVTPPGETIALTGTSGYEPFSITQNDTQLDLAFDSDGVWLADVTYLHPASLIMIR